MLCTALRKLDLLCSENLHPHGGGVTIYTAHAIVYNNIIVNVVILYIYYHIHNTYGIYIYMDYIRVYVFALCTCMFTHHNIYIYYIFY